MLSLQWVLILILRPMPLTQKYPPALIPLVFLEATSTIPNLSNNTESSPSVNNRLPLPLSSELALSFQLQEHASRNVLTVKLPPQQASIPLPTSYTPPHSLSTRKGIPWVLIPCVRRLALQTYNLRHLHTPVVPRPPPMSREGLHLHLHLCNS